MFLADRGQSHYLHEMHFQELIQLKFNQLGKATWLKIFMTSRSDTLGALEQLLIENETSEQQLTVLASFVCAAYFPKCIEISGIRYDWGQDYKRFSSMDWCSTHNLCSEMT